MTRTHRFAAVAVLTLLSLLDAPFAARAHSSETGIDPGTIALRLERGRTSEIIVDQQMLERELCDVLITNHSVGGIVVQGDGGGTGLRSLELRVVRHGHLGATTQLTLEPVSLLLVGPAPHPTSCGLWDYSVELDPGTTQPQSEIVLFENPRIPGTGTSAGILRIAAVVRFTASGTSFTRQIPMPLELNLATTWVLTPSGLAMATGESNLELFAQSGGGNWFPAPSCISEVSTGGQLCLEPHVAGR